jgi:hypothetical protein
MDRVDTPGLIWPHHESKRLLLILCDSIVTHVTLYNLEQGILKYPASIWAFLAQPGTFVM